MTSFGQDDHISSGSFKSKIKSKIVPVTKYFILVPLTHIKYIKNISYSCKLMVTSWQVLEFTKRFRAKSYISLEKAKM